MNERNFIITVLICFLSFFYIMPAAYAERTRTPEPSEYTLGSEDVLEILVWREADLSRMVVVRPDGRISFPLIGDIRAAGLKVEKLRENISEKLKEFIDNPTVSVIVSQANSMKIFVQGEISRPGVHQLGSKTTVLQAISLAGGFNEWAKKKKIIIIREKEGKMLRITVDYGKIISDEDMGQNIVLERGDTIIVP